MEAQEKIKVLFCWTNISGYMAASWRALSKSSDLEVFVCAYKPGATAPFSAKTMNGLNFRLLDEDERNDTSVWLNVLEEHSPSIVVTVGWGQAWSRRLYSEARKRGAKTILTIDTPYWGTLKQKLAPLLLSSTFRNVDMIVGTGERAWQYSKRLRRSRPIPIKRGLYGIDFDSFNNAYKMRSAHSEWPRSFLFVGRYSDEKGLDVLLEAYSRYRISCEQPWELKLCGTGKDPQINALIQGAEGVVDLGFQQPEDLPSIMADSGVFVLASRFDPWPLVVVEACAAGLPILCSEACGSSVETVRPFYNGLTVETSCATSMAKGLQQMHNQGSDLHEWGARSVQFAEPYSAENWAVRWREWLKSI
jgi:glycosyltransferase involved in cell wall biosynthesis